MTVVFDVPDVDVLMFGSTADAIAALGPVETQVHGGVTRARRRRGGVGGVAS